MLNIAELQYRMQKGDTILPPSIIASHNLNLFTIRLHFPFHEDKK